MSERYTTQYPLNGLTMQQFSMLVYQVCAKLGWQMVSVDGNSNTIVLITPRSAASYGEKVTIQVQDGTAVIDSKLKQWQLGGNKKNAKNLTDITTWLNELAAQYTPEQLDEAYINLYQQQAAYKKDLEERMQSGNLTAAEKISFKTGGHYVTYTLMAVNVAIFIVMVLSGAGFMDFDVDALFKWGGNTRALTANGEWYRLFTSIFIHGGLIHLAFNMYALFYIGLYLEPLLGRWRYLTVYLACGVFASLTSAWWRDTGISVGASGAIFGLYGVFLALLTTDFIDKNMRRAMLQSIGIFVVFNLVYGMKAGIDNSAHMGGLVSGAVFGYLYHFVFNRPKASNTLFAIVVVLITAAAVYFGLPLIKNRPLSDEGKYNKSLTRFSLLEEKGIDLLRKADSLHGSFSPALGDEFNTVALPAWNECKLIFDSAETYNLDAEIKGRIPALKQYVELRIKQAQLFASAEKEQTDKYNKQIETVSVEINKLLESFSKK